MKTNSTLIKAHALMTEYARATGAHIRVYDHNYLPIPENFDEMFTEKNNCLYCVKQHTYSTCENRNACKSDACESDACKGAVCKDTACKGDACKGDSCGAAHIPACEKLHAGAIRESHRSGESQTYTCELGFTFWTNPIYLNGRFIGALLGSGFSDNGDGRSKSLAELMSICIKSLSVGSDVSKPVNSHLAKQQSDLLAKIEEIKKQCPAGNAQPEYPLDKEQKMLEALREGDTEAGKKSLNEILATLLLSSPNNFGYIQYRAIELAILLSRIGINSGCSLKMLLENDSRNLPTIQKAKNIEEIADILGRIVDDLAGQVHCYQKMQHASSLRKAERYIQDNFSRKLSLEEIAGVSGFSAPYFSTIFKRETGENLSTYLSRLRVEKASALLIGTNLPLNAIANNCGFEDQSWFSKIFKAHTGMSPRRYRKRGGIKGSILPETGFSDDYPHPNCD
jgi:AraC-like DNA-binding protein